MSKTFCCAAFCLLASASVFCQNQLIQNGNFSSSSNWVISGNHWHISSAFDCNNTNSSPAYAFTGNVNGSYTNNMFGSLYQQLTIPSQATSASLTYKVSVNTYETVNTVKDVMQCQIRSSSNALLHQFNQLSNTNGTLLPGACQTYQVKGPFTIPPSLFGQPIRINFQVSTDNTNATVFRVDDVSVTYTVPSQTGSVKVTLSPGGAASAGAQWNLDGGSWRNSGTTVNNISTGTHTIYFKSVAGWVTPSSKNITVSSGNTTTTTGTYTTQSQTGGSVNVELSPPAVIADGARWNLDGGNWQNSGITLGNVSPGNHVVNFSNVPGWTSPSSKTITVTAGSTTPVTAGYQQSASAFTISGRVTHNSNGLNGVSLTATPGNISTSTNASGHYSLSLPQGWSGTITPFLSNYSFTPSSKSYTNLSTAQTGQDFSATAISVTPSVNSITVTNVIENHPGLDRNAVLYTGSPFVTNQPVKICADGAAATYISIHVSQPGGVTFRILNENNQVIADNASEGKLGTPYIFGGNNLEVTYTHPTILSTTALYRAFKLQVLHNGNPINGINFPLHIYRAPVVFVHGLYGMGSTFRACAEFLVANNRYPALQADNQNPLMHFVDYYDDGGHSFKTNRRIVRSGILAAFSNARRNKYSCGKVDVVAHSMGGILSRLYLQGTWADVPYLDDIHKLITLNTPHFGTQFANFVNPILNGVVTSPTIEVIKHVLLSLFGHHGTGAISDLRVDSKEISEYLNISTANQSRVPSHTISTVKSVNNADGGLGMEGIAKFILKRLAPDLFRGEQHDLVVPLSSQKAGFQWPISSDNQFHVGSSRNADVQNDLLVLLDANPSNPTHFRSSGFTPGQLTFRQRPPDNRFRMAGHDSVYFGVPLHGAVFPFGDSIPVNIVGSPGIRSLFFSENIHDVLSASLDTAQPSPSFKFRPGTKQVGKIVMGVLGASDKEIISADTVSIYVLPPDSLLKIELSPKSIEMNLGERARISINGVYRNQVLDIGNVSDLQVQVDSTRLQYHGNGILQAKGLFDSLIVFSFRGKLDTLHVRVINSGIAGAAGFYQDRHRVCAGETIKFIDDSKGLTTNRTWMFPGGQPSVTNEPNPLVTYPAAGFYKVTLITSFVNGKDTLAIDSLVEVNTRPTVVISGTNEICAGQSSMLDAGDGFAKYLWSTGDTTQTINYASAGVVSVTVNDQKGCAASDSFRLIVDPTVVPAVSLSVTSCVGKTITLRAAATHGGMSPSYFWTINGAGNLLTSDSILTFSNLPDSSMVQCTLVSSAKCANPLQAASSPLPVTLPNVAITGNHSFCEHGFTTLTAKGADKYYWNTGQSTEAIRAYSPGLYTVVGTNSMGCKDTSEIAIKMLPLPSVNLPNEIIVVHGERVRLGGSPTARGTAPLSYKWTPAYALESDTIANPMAEPHFNTKYQLLVTDGNGCTRAGEIHVAMSGFYIYPNPTADEVNIFGSKIYDGVYAVRLMNNTGQTIISKAFRTSAGLVNEKLSMTNLSAGIYVLTIEGPGGNYAFKVVRLQ